MSKSVEIVNVLASHFDVNGWPLHVTKEKLFDRYKITSDDALPGWDVVEIERHRPILGTTYVKGLGMSAFETYYMRYAVHVPSLEIRELPESREEIQIDIDGFVGGQLDSGVFELCIEPIDEKSYTIRDRVSKEKTVITSLEEAKDFATSLLDIFVDHFSDALYLQFAEQSPIDRDQNKKLIAEYEDCMKAALSDNAERAWKARDLWNEG